MSSSGSQLNSVTEQVDVLSQVVEEISGELALEPLLERIVERACRLIGADDGVIGLYEPHADAIRTAASFNIPESELWPLLPRGSGLTGRVLELDAPLRCRYKQLPNPTRVQALEEDMIGMPIRLKGQLVGVFGIGVNPPGRFADDAEPLLDLFARHAAIAIDNARRYSVERRRASRFALIARIAGIISSAPELDTLLQRAADAIHGLLEYQNVDIPLIDDENQDVLVVTVRGGDYKKRIQHVDRIPVGSGIMGAAVRLRRTQIVNDVSKDPRYVLPPGVQMPRSEMAVPIIHGSNVLGVLNVEGDHHFDELDSASLEVVAEHLAVAIANARLFEKSKQVVLLEERQRLARDLHDNVTQILSSMSLITQSLGDAWERDPKEALRRAGRLGELNRLAFAELRAMLHELSPQGTPPHARGSQTLSARLHRILYAMVPSNIRLDLLVECPPQAERHEEAILRVCQEAVSNAVRHASPSAISVVVKLRGKEVKLRVMDDGFGIDKTSPRGMGLYNMRQRLEELGGRIRIARHRPKGTAVTAAVPRLDRSQT